MCTPVGHSLAALGIFYLAGRRPSREETRRLGWFILLANLPDFDFIPGILVGDPGRYHHAYTHSIGFVLLIMLVAYWLGRPALGNRRLTTALLAFVLVGSHLVLDWLTWDLPGHNGQGIPLLWPWSDDYYLSPRTVFLRVERRDLLSGETLSNNLSGLLVEIAVLLPLVLLAAWWIRQRTVRCTESG